MGVVSRRKGLNKLGGWQDTPQMSLAPVPSCLRGEGCGEACSA